MQVVSVVAELSGPNVAALDRSESRATEALLSGLQALADLLLEAGLDDMHGGDHHDDDCPICIAIQKIESALRSQGANAEPVAWWDKEIGVIQDPRVAEHWRKAGYNVTPLYASCSPPESNTFQERVRPWMKACFSDEVSMDKVERNYRFLEEAIELVQACGCTQDESHRLVNYVYGRDQGDINQEVGGVMVTLAALCLASGFDMHTAAETELARIWQKIGLIRSKQDSKPRSIARASLSREESHHG